MFSGWRLSTHNASLWICMKYKEIVMKSLGFREGGGGGRGRGGGREAGGKKLIFWLGNCVQRSPIYPIVRQMSGPGQNYYSITSHYVPALTYLYSTCPPFFEINTHSIAIFKKTENSKKFFKKNKIFPTISLSPRWLCPFLWTDVASFCLDVIYLVRFFQQAQHITYWLF